MDKDKRKNVFSWIAFVCGISCFLYIILVLPNYVRGISFKKPKHYLLGILIAIVAISSGIYGLFGSRIKAVQIRSASGIIMANILEAVILFDLVTTFDA